MAVCILQNSDATSYQQDCENYTFSSPIPESDNIVEDFDDGIARQQAKRRLPPGLVEASPGVPRPSFTMASSAWLSMAITCCRLGRSIARPSRRTRQGLLVTGNGMSVLVLASPLALSPGRSGMGQVGAAPAIAGLITIACRRTGPGPFWALVWRSGRRIRFR